MPLFKTLIFGGTTLMATQPVDFLNIPAAETPPVAPEAMLDQMGGEERLLDENGLFNYNKALEIAAGATSPLPYTVEDPDRMWKTTTINPATTSTITWIGGPTTTYSTGSGEWISTNEII